MSPKLITSMVGSLDKTQASETVINFTSTPVTDLLSPANSEPGARSASNPIADPLTAAWLPPVFRYTLPPKPYTLSSR